MNVIKGIIQLADDVAEFDRDVAEAAIAVKQYLLEMSYLKHKSTKERLYSYIYNECDLANTVKALEAQGHEITLAALKSTLSYISKRIQEELGEDILNDIKFAPELVFERLIWKHKHTKGIFLKGLKTRRDSFYITMPLSCCKNELLFLLEYSKSLYEFRKEPLNSEALRFLFNLIENPKTSDIYLSLQLIEWLQSAGGDEASPTLETVELFLQKVNFENRALCVNGSTNYI